MSYKRLKELETENARLKKIHPDLSEREARKRNIPYRLFKVPMIAVLPTRTFYVTRGFPKALIEEDGDRILGIYSPLATSW